MSQWVVDILSQMLGTDMARLAYYCGSIVPQVIAMTVISHIVTWLSYIVIGGWFILFVARAKVSGWSNHLIGSKIAQIFDVWLVVLVGLFVVTCGMGHLEDVLLAMGKVDRLTVAYFHSATATVSAVSAAYLLWRSHGK